MICSAKLPLKAGLATNCSSLAKRIKGSLGDLAGSGFASYKLLGADTRAGRSRAAGAKKRNDTMLARLTKVAKRFRRVHMFTKAKAVINPMNVRSPGAVARVDRAIVINRPDGVRQRPDPVVDFPGRRLAVIIGDFV